MVERIIRKEGALRVDTGRRFAHGRHTAGYMCDHDRASTFVGIGERSGGARLSAMKPCPRVAPVGRGPLVTTPRSVEFREPPYLWVRR